MAFAQERTTDSFSRQIYFKKMYTLLDTTYKDNAKHMAFIVNEIGRILEDPQMGISKISVVSSASPDGYQERNEKYANERAESISNIIVGRYPQTKNLFEVKSLGIDWDGAIRVVEESDVKYKEEVLKILREYPVQQQKNGKMSYPRIDNLRRLRGGIPYRWLTENSFKELRKTVVVVYFWKEIPAPEPPKKDTVVAPPVEPVVEPAPVVEPVIEPLPQPVIAVKTNFLYDFGATPNISVEIPLGKKWSVAAEYTFPWWVWKNNSRAWQILYWDLSARRWLGNRDKKDVLSGWFVGLTGGAGYYDIEPHRSLPHRGWQGWFWTGSLEGGYAFWLNDRWSMEFSVAAGYLGTDYSKYKGVMEDEHLVWQHDSHRHYFGPTKANASIVYHIYRKGDKKKRQQLREQRRHENENN